MTLRVVFYESATGRTSSVSDRLHELFEVRDSVARRRDDTPFLAAKFRATT